MKINIKKLRKIILILAITILIGILLMLILLTNKTDNRIDYIYSAKEGTIDMMPQNVSSLFMEYAGIIEQRSIYKAMYVFVNDMVKDYYLKFKIDSNQEMIEKYYNQNIAEIQKELGITNKEEFVKFISTLNKLKDDELKLKQYIIIPESLKQVPGATKFVLAVDYENNERILFELELLNSSAKNKTPINYKVADDTYMNYEQKKDNTDYTNVEVIQRPGKIIK